MLRQLELDHAPALSEALSRDDLWRTWYTIVPAPDRVEEEITRRLDLQAAGSMAPWTIFDAATDLPVGMTTYMNIDAVTPRVEVGSTWLLRSAQRSGINAHTKRLVLGRAFDDLGCLAVEFRTHFHNHQSRDALARLGAKQDGVLRHHQMFAGVPRDTVVFSIIDAEWSTVRLSLDERIAAGERRAADG
ncbi:MAG: GNAT family protein [Nesterenkonia sp.]|nr:GNAT family protein [Nesterenkonia sp.]